ncbi:MAG TPA: glycosyltransferase family 39 protein [Solirubrobacteraceae bacterium]|jgi:4-amino-4-deoxy-L-arabinose transferase-like glycosyltransferase|nr:glycosyltransferase family 39 protein [Solirubrobacteraceae bacterium]
MPTAEPQGSARVGPRGGEYPNAAPAGARPAPARAGWRADERRWVWPALAVLLLAALGLRLWGVGQGLPYVYNIDEAGHFVPKAVQMFAPGHGLNPGYFVNPPALTYALHLAMAVWFGGAHGVLHEYAAHPDHVFMLSRVLVALLGTGAVWLLYLFAARLFDRRVALLAAAIEAVAFLPVFYGHLALNDAATLLPLTLSLLGSAGVLRSGRRRDYAIAGLGLGLACASKYTAGIAVVPLAAAAASRYLDTPAPAGRRTLVGLAIAGGCALGAFLLANPYALLDFSRFRSELIHQSSLSEEAQGKLGAPTQGGLIYYLWALTWGLGWIPSLAALGGAIAVWRRDARAGWLLVAAPILFLAFMGLQDRYFGRWLLPIFPILGVLAAFFALRMIRALAARTRVPVVLTALVVSVLMLAQGGVYSVHDDVVLARADTRNLTREWMVTHIPPGTRIVIEPVVLNSWLWRSSADPVRRWQKYPTLESVIAPNGALAPQDIHPVALEDYETTLSPALIGWYERQGYCWAITGSTESGRAQVDPRAAPLAVAYYRALAARGTLLYSASPYSSGSKSPAFSFDWSFDYYPLAYRRPGPAMAVYRLRGGRCGRGG